MEIEKRKGKEWSGINYTDTLLLATQSCNGHLYQTDT